MNGNKNASCAKIRIVTYFSINVANLYYFNVGMTTTVNKIKRFWLIIALFCFAKFPFVLAQSTDTLPFDTTNYKLTEVVFKLTPQAELKLHLYSPVMTSSNQLPAILFFFGGGWVNGSHQHFAPHSKYLASRGMVAVTADYRVKNQHGTSPIEAIQDARSALTYLAGNGKNFGIDTAKIAVGGGSAGGHLALATALIDDYDQNQALRYQPKALVLFNPVVNTSSEGFGAKHFGADSIKASPIHQIDSDMPVTIIFHGKSDTTVPVENILELKEKMDSLGVPLELKLYPEQKHAFFNIGRQAGHLYFLKTLYETDKFLIEHGFLSGQPSFKAPQ